MNNVQENVELRIRTMRMLWFGMLSSIGAYYVFTLFAGPRENSEPNDMLSLILLVIGLSTTLLSFLIKNRLLARAIEKQQVPLVQQAYILAWAIAEVAALLGVLDFIATGHRHFYILFIISALGQLLHFPRSEHVVNASLKTPIS